MTNGGQITRLLGEIGQGNKEAINQLLPWFTMSCGASRGLISGASVESTHSSPPL